MTSEHFLNRIKTEAQVYLLTYGGDDVEEASTTR